MIYVGNKTEYPDIECYTVYTTEGYSAASTLANKLLLSISVLNPLEIPARVCTGYSGTLKYT
jgi:hypothetical protein